MIKSKKPKKIKEPTLTGDKILTTFNILKCKEIKIKGDLINV
ncbi:hypothetical protein M33023_00360 [Candidatus Phytoplasma asteris]|uniref:Uncharacterized protein n=1 Tax=Candidatus Phytoplasma asteris TaxID=85620 RepID=A0ABZ2YFI4_9MOLU